MSAGDWRCLTVRPPWAWAMSVEGPEGKGVENRGANTNWREWVAIHSGKEWSEWGKDDPRITRLVGRRVMASLPDSIVDAVVASLSGDIVDAVVPLDLPDVDLAPPGIVAIARVVDSHLDEGCCRPWGETDYVHADGHQVRRVWHWVLADRRRVDPPLPVPRGYQGLWKPDPDLADELARLVA